MTKEEILRHYGIYPGFRSTYTYEGILSAMGDYAALIAAKPIVTCRAFRTWLQQVNEEQQYYPLFKGRELDEVQLLNLWHEGKSPVDALNDLATAC